MLGAVARTPPVCGVLLCIRVLGDGVSITMEPISRE